ncbi:MAG: YqjF family protein [Isosphaeraceae bacterium]
MAIDRITPALPPRRWPVMRQQWRDLLFLHWPISPEVLRPLVPPHLELDLFEGQAYVGLVPFTMKGVRPVGLPAVRGLSSFHETNVRTYVHHAGRDPGVWFFSLDAANAIAVALARRFFHLPYFPARMFLEREARAVADAPQPIVYAGVRLRSDPRPASYLIRAVPAGPVHTAEPGELEHFLIERYLLYTLVDDRVYVGQVHHRPYPVQSAAVLSLDEALLRAAGIPRPDLRPLAHFASGVDVKVYVICQVDR